MSLSKGRALMWLTIIWVLARIYPALMGWSSFAACAEIRAAHKLLEYGFGHLHGAVLTPGSGFGRVAHPEHYFYAHHPYPLFWFHTLVYHLFGFAGVSVVLYSLKYAALVSCFLVLDRCFSRAAAFWAAVLYAIAPLYVLTDGGSNSVIFTSIVWPISLAVVLLRLQRRATAGWGDVWLAGATTFLMGQCSWFALSIVPSLALVASGATSLGPRGIRAMLTHRLSRALVAGAVLSLVVFVGQIALYEGGLDPFMKYATTKAGKSISLGTRFYIMALAPVRMGFFVGMALTAASVLGLYYVAKDRSLREKHPVMGVTLYLILFAGMAVIAPAAFVQENHFYPWLIFPGTVLAAMLFDKAGRRLRTLILGLGVVSLCLGLLYAGVPLYGSRVAVYLGEVFAAHSKQTDFLFTNIRPPGPPYKASDIAGDVCTQITADRYITYGVVEPGQLCLAKDLISADSKFQYWRLQSLPISPALEAELAANGKLLQTIPVTFPPITETLPEKLRAFVWYSVMKKGKRLERSRGPTSDVMELYEVTLAPENLLDYSIVGQIPPRTNAPPALPQM